jgi:hypothetical protein
MLAVVAPIFSYFESLWIKELCYKISEKIRDSLDWNIEDYQHRIAKS